MAALSRDQIAPDHPVRLKFAAQLFFPDGTMTERGLRRLHARGLCLSSG